MSKIKCLPDYFWHLYLCWQSRRRGELCEGVSLDEFKEIGR